MDILDTLLRFQIYQAVAFGGLYVLAFIIAIVNLIQDKIIIREIKRFANETEKKNKAANLTVKH